MKIRTVSVFSVSVLDIAKKGAGYVSPNPLVGCVITKNNEVVATGYHKCFGGPHAEKVALRRAGQNARGATMYVNLEPCCHTNKKTPPCVPEIVSSGIKNVVVSMKDPNPSVNGKGIKLLRSKGINVKVGILEQEAKKLNKFYMKYITKKLPYVILKYAMSFDGKIATKNGDSKWISSEKSRDFVHKLRSEVDAVLVGVNTIVKDNSELTAHGKGRNPIRIVIDPELRIPMNSKILKTKFAQTIIVTSKMRKTEKKLERMNRRNLKVVCFNTSKNGKIRFKQIAKCLAKMNIASILVEGGGETNALALNSGIVDEIMMFIAPKIIGGKNAVGPVGSEGVSKIKYALNTGKMYTEFIGKDLLIRTVLSQ